MMFLVLRLVKLLTCFALIGGAAGCSWTDKGGTHHLIVGIGFGVITATNRTGIEVTDTRILGMSAGPEGAGVGWMRHHRVAIDPALASNAVVSVKATSWNLTVKNFDPFATNTNQTKSGTNEIK